jgi:hypothetical protein
MNELDLYFYEEGQRLGRKHGEVKSLNSIMERIEFDSDEEDADEEHWKEIIIAYNELGEKVPIRSLNASQNCTREPIHSWLMGYANGAEKYNKHREQKNRQKQYGSGKIKSKTYEMHADVLEAFAEACRSAGMWQTETLEMLMMTFVKSVKAEKEREKL